MNLSAQLDKRLVPITPVADYTERYLRVQVITPANKPSARLPLNIALVIDRSGSMAGGKLKMAQEAAIAVLRNLTGEDRAAVVSYDDQVRVVAPSRLLTAAVKDQVMNDVRNLYAGGSTNLGGGWLSGADEVANHIQEAEYLSRVMLLSDGLANVGIIDPEELARHASELRVRGVSTSTLGIGGDFNEELLEAMSIKGGGHFYFIEHPRNLPDMLLRELGEVLSTVARHATIELDVPEGVHATLLNSFEVDRRGKHFSVRLDDILAGEVRSIVFRLSIRGGQIGAALPIRVKLTYTGVGSREVHSVETDEARLLYASERECLEEVPNNSVVDEAALLVAAHAREAALRYDREGNHEMSAASLASAAAHLRAVAPASPLLAAEADLLEANSAEARQGFTSMSRKSIYYNQSARKQNRQT